MSGHWKPVAWIVLCCFLGGCSTYGVRALPVADPGVNPDAAESEPLRAGDDLRLTLVDGRRIEGEFAGYAGEDLLVCDAREKGGPGDALTEVPFSAVVDTIAFHRGEISRLEVLRTNVGGQLFAAAGIIAAAWMMIYAMNHTLDDVQLDFENP